MVAVLEAVVERLGDDLGLVAVDTRGGELLRDVERIEHAGRLPRSRGRGAQSPAQTLGSILADFEAKETSSTRFSARMAVDAGGPDRLTERRINRLMPDLEAVRPRDARL